MDDFESRIAALMRRVQHSAYINTDLACRFVMDEIHGMADRVRTNLNINTWSHQ